MSGAITSDEPLMNCDGHGPMHQWPTGDDFCTRCDASWIDVVHAIRGKGLRLWREPAAMHLDYLGERRPTYSAMVSFHESLLDDPEQVAALVENAKRVAARSNPIKRQVDEIAFEEPLIGRTRMGAYEMNVEWQRDTTLLTVGRVYVWGDLAR